MTVSAIVVREETNMSTYDASEETSADTSTPLAPGLPDWWPLLMGGPTIPWHDDEESRNSALSVGAEHDRLLDAYHALGERNGGGFMGTMRGMLAEYARRDLISQRDAERLRAILSALQQSDADAAIETVLRLHEEAVADPAAKPAALAVSSIAAASARRARQNFEVDTGSGALHEVVHAAADAGGAVYAIPFGPPGMILMATAASALSDAHHVHVEVQIR